MFLHNLLNVLVWIAIKMGLQKKIFSIRISFNVRIVIERHIITASFRPLEQFSAEIT
jgi:hypothetical protein